MGRTRAALKTLARSVRRKPDVEDPTSVDPAVLRSWAPLLDDFCRLWFRLEVRGVERVPEGPALFVGNHNSGTSFVEAMGVWARLYRDRGTDQLWHGLAHDAIVDLPGLGRVMSRLGAVRAGHDSARRIFELGRKVVVFPGGNREAFRPWSQRNEVQFYGRKGFIRLALRHGVPIVPVVFHGGHNGLFILHDGERLARALRMDRVLRSDTWPLWVGLPWGVALGPWFHVPLPVKCVTEFLDPIPTAEYGPESAEDPEVLQALYDQVQGVMQDRLDALADEFPGMF